MKNIWPEILTWRIEYTTEERKQNLIDVIKFAKSNGCPCLKANIIMWETELKNFDTKNK